MGRPESADLPKKAFDREFINVTNGRFGSNDTR